MMRTWFYGHEVSEEGKKYNRVDYRTLAQSFEGVMNNNIISELSNAGYYFEEINQFEEDENGDIIYPDIFQYFIIDDGGARILQEYAPYEPLFYCEVLDMYVWGVTHYGTSWDYVLTDIVLDEEEEERRNAK